MDFKRLKQASADSIGRATYNPKKLAMLHIGATLLLSILLTVINYFLVQGINSTTGLSNMNTRAILVTAQAVLSVINLVAMPFWTIGFLAVALRTARWSNALPGDLLDGFRHFGPVLRLYLLQFAIYMLVAFACSQVASILYSFTPYLQEVTASLQEAMAAGQTTLSDVDLAALLPKLMPMYGIFLVLFCAVAIPLFYRFRMSFFAVADGETSARKALGLSTRMLRNKKLQLFKLDLRFWWYYGLQLLLATLGYAGTLLDLTEISLPYSKDLWVYGAFALYCILQLIISWQFSMKVETTYAHYYDELKAQMTPEPNPFNQANPWQNNWKNQE